MTDGQTRHTKKVKEPRNCIFCGSRPLSKEHIYADWMKEFIPGGQASTLHWLTTVDPDTRATNVETGNLARTGEHRSRGLRVVCTTCNNGWMSQLQTRAMPALLPLLNVGEAKTPNRDEQRRIAAWAAMFTIVFEHADPKTVAVTEHHRRTFKKRQMPDSHWAIWIARFDGERYRGSTQHRSFALVDDAQLKSEITIKTNAQHTLGAVGALAFLTFYLQDSVDQTVIAREMTPILKGFGFCRVWPPAGYKQSFDGQMTDDTIPTFLDTLMGPLESFHSEFPMV